MSDTNAPEKKSKAQLEQIVKSNGGKIYQTNTAAPDTLCIADRSKLPTSRHEVSKDHGRFFRGLTKYINRNGESCIITKECA